MTYKISPIGTAADFPWITEADTKFNADGLFHTGLVLDGEDAAALKAEVQAAAEEGFELMLKDKTAGERKKFSLYVPFEAEVDDEGNETGRTMFTFKQNQVIEKKDGTKVTVQIGLKDANDEEITDPKVKIFNGDKIRIMYQPRATIMTGLKKAGCRLDFAKVQLVKKAPRGASKGFGKVDLGEDQPQGFGKADTKSEGAPSDGDY